MRRATSAIAAFTLVLLCVSFPASADQTPRQSLRHSMPELNFSGVALSDAIEFLRDASGANIHVDWKTLEAAGVAKDTQINLRLRGVTLGRVVDLVLKEAG